MSGDLLREGDPLHRLRGVGPARARALSAVGLETIGDLLLVLPKRYEDRRAFARVSDLVAGGREATLDVRVAEARVIRTRRRGFSIFEAWLEDSSGRIQALWYNQAFLARAFTPGRRVVVFGRPVAGRGGAAPVLQNPDHEFLDDADRESIHVGRYVPVYRRLKDLSPRMQRNLIHAALDALDDASLGSRLPPEILDRHPLPPRGETIRRLHFPDDDTDPADLLGGRTEAHRAMAFEETVLLQLALGLGRGRRRRRAKVRSYDSGAESVERVRRALPYRLTGAQERVLGEILGDLRAPRPMSRLLQGDVGSGKTVVAMIALLTAVASGFQGALMAPTEILAEQHARWLGALVGQGGASARVGLLTGSTAAAERRELLKGIDAGEIDLVVGTHALFESGVSFRDLALAVVDEQHRFGVAQRAALAGKGSVPDVLVMSATPIPRSLALTVYGDLDLSVIDRLPPGRTPVTTVVRSEAERDRVYRGIRAEVEAGRQVYVVAPLVDESEGSDLKAVTAVARSFETEVFPGVPVGLLHGRLSGADKDAVMRGFAEGRTRILVATTVVEVGLDIPNATVMVVEHAERFGLSQLHQLRGRVGRGTARSFCVLMVGSEAPGPEARERLAILSETNDGFRIAEKDLEIRGPGVVFGRDQHGAGDLRFLETALRDPSLLETARREARRFLRHRAPTGEETARIVAGLPPGWRRRLVLGGTG